MPSSASAQPASGSARGKRSRTVVACMYCRKRRIKCSGEAPCASCKHLGRECLYVQTPKKPRPSLKATIASLTAENKRLREERAMLRTMTSTNTSAAPAAAAGTAAATATTRSAAPADGAKAAARGQTDASQDELAFLRAYAQHQVQGFFPIVPAGTLHRFASAHPAVGTLQHNELALYLAVTAFGAALAGQPARAQVLYQRAKLAVADGMTSPDACLAQASLVLGMFCGAQGNAMQEQIDVCLGIQVLSSLSSRSAAAAAAAAAGRTAAAPAAVAPVPVDTAVAAYNMALLTPGLVTMALPVPLVPAGSSLTLSLTLAKLLHTACLVATSSSSTAATARAAMLAADSRAALATLAACGPSQRVPAAFPVLAQACLAIALCRAGDGMHAAAAAAASARAAVAAQSQPAWVHPLFSATLAQLSRILCQAGDADATSLYYAIHCISNVWPAALRHRTDVQELQLRSARHASSGAASVAGSAAGAGAGAGAGAAVATATAADSDSDSCCSASVASHMSSQAELQGEEAQTELSLEDEEDLFMDLATADALNATTPVAPVLAAATSASSSSSSSSAASASTASSSCAASVTSADTGVALDTAATSFGSLDAPHAKAVAEAVPTPAVTPAFSAYKCLPSPALDTSMLENGIDMQLSDADLLDCFDLL